MADALSHRGPDDRGVAILGNIGLAHTRLSIIDVSQAGHQPYVEGPYGLTYNGEIYNYLQLRRELEREGVRFIGHSDTEVLFRSLVHRGVPATLASLKGMFAFAFANGDTGDLYLCRDRLGIKPLNYLVADGSFYFASEIKAIDAAVPIAPDPVHTLFALAGATDRSRYLTAFTGVEQVQPGHYLHVRSGQPTLSTRWYNVIDEIDQDYYNELASWPFSKTVEHLRSLLDASVEAMLMSDPPIGAFVSGGVDSAVIASLAARRHHDFTMFTADVMGSYSEVADARRLSEHLGRPLQEAPFSPEMMISDWASATLHLECPLVTHTNAVPFATVARRARECGVKAVLTGEGADELFLGYPTLAAARYIRVLRRPVEWTEGLFSLLPGAREKVFPRNADLREVFLRHLSEGFSEPADDLESTEALSFVPRRHRDEHALCLNMLRQGLVTLLLRNDRMGMKASIESRFPFLDENVVRFGVNLPVQFKIRWVREWHDRKHPFLMDKAVVRAVGRELLPPELATKRKEGFSMYGHKNVRVRRGAFLGGYVSELVGLTAQAEDRMIEAADPYFVAKLVSVEVFGKLFAERLPVAEVDSWLMQNVTMEI